MPREYKRKSDRATRVTSELVLKALRMVKEEGKSLRKVSKIVNIPAKSLSRYAKKFAGDLKEFEEEGKPLPVGYVKSRQVFTPEQETELVTYLRRVEGLYHGLAPKDVRKFAFQHAVAIEGKSGGIASKIPDRWCEKKEAGVDWLAGFLKRHPELSLSVRTGDATSSQAGKKGEGKFDKADLDKFFDNLEGVLN